MLVLPHELLIQLDQAGYLFVELLDEEALVLVRSGDVLLFLYLLSDPDGLFEGRHFLGQRLFGLEECGFEEGDLVFEGVALFSEFLLLVEVLALQVAQLSLEQVVLQLDVLGVVVVLSHPLQLDLASCLPEYLLARH